MRIKCQMTLPDGKTPGRPRHRISDIKRALLAGARICPNPLNRITEEQVQKIYKELFDEYGYKVVDNDPDVGTPERATKPEPQAVTVPDQPAKKRGRPKKVKP